MLRMIVSGGQSGVDQAGLRAARALGLETGGYAPEGWKTEDGPAPWLADFGLTILPGADYPERNRRNVGAADATLIVHQGYSGLASRGTDLTVQCCIDAGKPCVYLNVMWPTVDPVLKVAREIVEIDPAMLNIAGNRESRFPGIGKRAEDALILVLATAVGLGRR
jgi:hypothetical protein